MNLESQNWPDFLIIGAARSGTTSLYHILSQHPEISMCKPKEPHFFSLLGQRPTFTGPGDDMGINSVAVTDPCKYLELFSRFPPNSRKGEASVSYLYYPQSAANIHRLNSKTRIIIGLRDPVARAFSSYMCLRYQAYESLSFEKALAVEEERKSLGWHHLWHYRSMSCYAEQLEPYLRLFPSDQLFIYLYDDLRDTPHRVLSDLSVFLDIDPNQMPRVAHHNRSGAPRSQWAARLLFQPSNFTRRLANRIPSKLRLPLSRWARRLLLTKQRMSPQVETSLRSYFHRDVERVEELINRDLDHWKQSARQEADSF